MPSKYDTPEVAQFVAEHRDAGLPWESAKGRENVLDLFNARFPELKTGSVIPLRKIDDRRKAKISGPKRINAARAKGAGIAQIAARSGKSEAQVRELIADEDKRSQRGYRQADGSIKWVDLKAVKAAKENA